MTEYNTVVKRCPKCGETKARGEFAKCKTKYDGLQGWCKACQAEIRETHREEYRQYGREYRLTDEFKENRALYCQTHRTELTKSHREWCQKNKERARQLQKKYIQTPKGRATEARVWNRRRSREETSQSDLTIEQWELILYLQKNTCPGCGREFGDDLKPTRDHVVPLISGGGLTFDNVQALCPPCNSSKNTKSIDYRWWTGMSYEELISCR